MLLTHVPYIVSIALFCTSMFFILSNRSYFIRIAMMSVMQLSVLLFYISLGKVMNGTVPVYSAVGKQIISNPLPHVLMLTAIVVGFATTSVALSLLTVIKRDFNKKTDEYTDNFGLK